MKNSKFKNIISAINPITKNDSIKTNEDEYTEVVSGTETFSPSNRMMRTVSSIAAVAVLVAGIGATGFMLHKNNANSYSMPEKNDVSTEPTDITESSDIADSGAVAPFADFKQVYFELYKLNNYDSFEYSNAAYEKLAVFLNNFNWGEENEIAENDIPDFDYYEGNGYNISWRTGDVWFYINITEEGKAYFISNKCTPDGGNFYYPIIESSVFNIDYVTLNNGIQDILSSDVTDTGDYLSKKDKIYLTQGEFQNGMLESCEGYDSKAVIPDENDSFKALQGFLRDDFVDLLQKDKSLDYEGNELIYTVACYYKTSDTTTRRLTYYISSNGVANLCEYELTDDASIPTGCSNYYININEFESVLNDILSGKYDNKYSFDENTTTTTVTTSTTETTTVNTTEQISVSEEDTKEKPAEEAIDENISSEFYMENNT